MRLFLISLLTLFFSSPTFAQITPPIISDQAGIISLSGTGEIYAAPDIAYINTGVVSVAKTAREALAQNSNAMAKLIDVLQNAGLEERDIQTSNFNVSPQYSYNSAPNNNQPPKIANYRVSNSVRIIVRDLDNLGNIIDQSVSVGANSINSVSFSIEDNSDLLNQARKLAMQDAIKKATLYVNAANIKLGKIRVISENSSVMPPVPQFEMTRMAITSDGAPTPMQSGELSLRSNINVSWKIIQ